MSSKLGGMPTAPGGSFPGSIRRVHSNFPGTPQQPQAHKLTQTHISIYFSAMEKNPTTFSENALLSETKNAVTRQIAAHKKMKM